MGWRSSPGFLKKDNLIDGTYTQNNYLDFPRTKLINLSLKHPNIIDAKFVQPLVQMDDNQLKNMFMKSGYVGQRLSIVDQLQYKYQMLIDGNTSSWTRAYWQIFSNSVIFKQESNNIQWYYNYLQPFVHYIPVKHDLSDLVEKIEWAQAHNDSIQKIIENANNFAYNNLQYEDLLLYMYLTLNEYAKLQKFRI